MYSGGNGQVFVLGVVPHSHITIVVYSMEDGEIIKQVTFHLLKLECLPSRCRYERKAELKFVPFFGLGLFQVSVEAPWLSNIPASCAVVGQGTLMCVDSTTMSLNTLDLHQQLQMTQIPLQVSSKPKQNSFNSMKYLPPCFHLCLLSILMLFSPSP